LNIVNNSGNPYTVALYYTRNVIRTCLFKYNLDGGDIVQDKGPYVILANDNLEIETDAGVEVTFSMLRQPL
jgi:hypothetical protein